MNKLLIPISDDEFKLKIKIRFNNILDGFDSFKNFTITNDNNENREDNFIKLLEHIFEENNCEAYIDFYINKLSNEDKEKLTKLLSDEDKKILNLHLNTESYSGVYYKLENKELIPFLVRLNTREIFFITFYFNNRPITIWGNYDYKFPCFFDNEDDLSFYSDFFKSHGFLIINKTLDSSKC